MFGKKNIIIPITVDVLKILGASVLIGGVIIIPSTAVIVTPILKYIRKELDRREEIKNAKFDKVCQVPGLVENLSSCFCS